MLITKIPITCYRCGKRHILDMETNSPLSAEEIDSIKKDGLLCPDCDALLEARAMARYERDQREK